VVPRSLGTGKGNQGTTFKRTNLERVAKRSFHSSSSWNRDGCLRTARRRQHEEPRAAGKVTKGKPYPKGKIGVTRPDEL